LGSGPERFGIDNTRRRRKHENIMGDETKVIRGLESSIISNASNINKIIEIKKVGRKIANS
jgi:hypothetical protein